MKELGREEGLETTIRDLSIMKRLTARVHTIKHWVLSFNLEPLYRFIARTLIRMIYHVDYKGFDKIP